MLVRAVQTLPSCFLPEAQPASTIHVRAVLKKRVRDTLRQTSGRPRSCNLVPGFEYASRLGSHFDRALVSCVSILETASAALLSAQASEVRPPRSVAAVYPPSALPHQSCALAAADPGKVRGKLWLLSL